MKALTLTQPWATLVAIGAKRIETRSWRTSFRGPIAIHAAKGFPKWAREFSAEPACYDIHRMHYTAYPVGSVLAAGLLVDCIPTESIGCLPGVFDEYPKLDTERERAFGDYSPGRWAWILEDVAQYGKPIPAKGALSLWDWSGPDAG